MSDQKTYVTTQEMVAQARRSVSQPVWNYITGAAETESTMRRNRHALDSLAFRPRVLRDVLKIDTSGSFLGHKLRIPVMLAPMGSLQMISPGGGVEVAQAAAEFGTINFVSTVTQPSLEEIAASAECPMFFQIYVRGDEKWVDDLMDRAREAGFAGFALTVDSAFYGRRERQLNSRWLPDSVRVQTGREHQMQITWDWMAHMKEHAGDLPFMLKGIQTAEDAALAVDHGVDAIYVSNHGGRQLDYGLGTVDILREVAEVVDGRIPLVVDGGFARGTDVMKAVALGATAVAMGRMQAWAMAAAGKDGIVRLLEILEAEMENSMGLIGVTSLDQLTPDYVARAASMMEGHEFGAFPLLDPNLRL